MNQYIHIGAEVAAITALTIRFQKELTALKERIAALEADRKPGRGPKVLFAHEPAKTPNDFFMSFFPMFTPAAAVSNTVSIEEIVESEQDPKEQKQIKDTFLKHLAFLADPDAQAPDDSAILTNSLF